MNFDNDCISIHLMRSAQQQLDEAVKSKLPELEKRTFEIYLNNKYPALTDLLACMADQPQFEDMSTLKAVDNILSEMQQFRITLANDKSKIDAEFKQTCDAALIVAAQCINFINMVQGHDNDKQD